MSTQYQNFERAFEKVLIVVAITFGALATLSCGKNQSNDSVNQQNLGASCQPGFMYHPSYGCVNPSGCPTGYASYRGSCDANLNTAVGNTSCPAGLVMTQLGICGNPTNCSSGFASVNGGTCNAQVVYYGGGGAGSCAANSIWVPSAQQCAPTQGQCLLTPQNVVGTCYCNIPNTYFFNGKCYYAY